MTATAYGVTISDRDCLSMWTQALHKPQTLWIRRALFQAHLWTGMALALYVIVLSATGSVLVYRNELNILLATRKPAFDPNLKRLTTEQSASQPNRCARGDPWPHRCVLRRAAHPDFRRSGSVGAPPCHFLRGHSSRAPHGCKPSPGRRKTVIRVTSRPAERGQK